MDGNNPDPHDLVRDAFAALGFAAERIGEQHEQKTPDFVCKTSDGDFLIELKTRYDDPAETTQRQETFEAGKVHGFSQRITRRNTVAGIVADAVDQLRAWPNPSAFRVAWLHAGDHRSHMKFEQFKSSLLGAVTLFSMDLPHTSECLYFDDSDFFRFRRELDGAIVTRLDGTRLEGSFYLNNHGKRYREMKASALPQAFGAGLFLPDEKEAPPHVLFADCDIDRKNQQAVIGYLSAKYGFKHLQRIDLAYHEGSVRAPE